MKKGIVMEKKKRFMVIMTNEGEFIRAKLDTTVRLGDEVSYIPLTPIHLQSSIYKSYSMQIAAVVLFLLLLPVIPLFTGEKVFGTIMIDMNPSIEFTVNQDYHVIETHGYNPEGSLLLTQITTDLEGLSLNEAMTVVIEEGNKMGYLSDWNDIYITSPKILTIDEFWGEDYEIWTQRMQEKYAVNFISLTVDQELLAEAKEYSISPPKYLLFEQAKENGIELNLQEVNARTIQELELNAGIELENIVVNETITIIRSENGKQLSHDPADVDKDKSFKTKQDHIEYYIHPGNRKGENHPSNNNPGKGKKKGSVNEEEQGEAELKEHPSDMKSENKNRNGNRAADKSRGNNSGKNISDNIRENRPGNGSPGKGNNKGNGGGNPHNNDNPGQKNNKSKNK
ncbi:anti-sigma factor domain-containing protein [Evansella tamaricis]|uniref:Anti-sigma factor domain-containing protein n=1 Tax=Evansella tamaricis TaxID=2069301 RepID=A0ABS6JCC1_9BACI|nr:anti-sigma factor domain-containing protein [Evansella tamaricis]MBU9711327.1 anti-sigma factor domain-containing protein [Evansella tamaricis]